MRFQSYLNTATKIISAYKGEEPLANYLKKFFATDKKYGSKDRRSISALCYNYYRLGKASLDIPIKERIVLATFLCEHSFSDLLQNVKPEWNEKITLSTEEKLLLVNIDATTVFPFANELSVGIDHQQFSLSFFQQPDLFLRIRPGKNTIVESKLKTASLSYKQIDENCIALPNSSKLDDVIELNKEAIVQDYNSQKVLNALQPQTTNLKPQTKTWDCCAASGGKSILLYDILKGQIDLSVSDIRESILSNLRKRFAAAGIKKYHSFIADLNSGSVNIPPQQLIICDAPCTGSGTWARTPEQLFFFNESQIDVYAERQRNIVSNVIPHLANDGLFVYITCSVFKKENEEVVNFIKEKFHLQLLQMELLKGYDVKADSMFTAVFKKTTDD